VLASSSGSGPERNFLGLPESGIPPIGSNVLIIDGQFTDNNEGTPLRRSGRRNGRRFDRRWRPRFKLFRREEQLRSNSWDSLHTLTAVTSRRGSHTVRERAVGGAVVSLNPGCKSRGSEVKSATSS
jgi:hypothetical protein